MLRLSDLFGYFSTQKRKTPYWMQTNFYLQIYDWLLFSIGTIILLLLQKKKKKLNSDILESLKSYWKCTNISDLKPDMCVIELSLKPLALSLIRL